VEYYPVLKKKKKEGNPIILNNVDEPGGHNVE
jgi:hypothetical protein